MHDAPSDWNNFFFFEFMQSDLNNTPRYIKGTFINVSTPIT